MKPAKSPELRARLSAKAKASWRDPEIVARRLAGMKRVQSDPAVRQRFIESRTPEVKAKIAAAVRRAWAEPGARERRREAMKGRCRVPAWVKKAGLVEDFRDVARREDEFAAAAHCRRLKAEMVAHA